MSKDYRYRAVVGGETYLSRSLRKATKWQKQQLMTCLIKDRENFVVEPPQVAIYRIKDNCLIWQSKQKLDGHNPDTVSTTVAQ